jgi:hypothetical protein
LSYINTALSQSAFRIYKCYIIIFYSIYKMVSTITTLGTPWVECAGVGHKFKKKSLYCYMLMLHKSANFLKIRSFQVNRLMSNLQSHGGNMDTGQFYLLRVLALNGFNVFINYVCMTPPISLLADITILQRLFQNIRPVNSPGATGRLPVLTFFSRSPGIKIFSPGCLF